MRRRLTIWLLCVPLLAGAESVFEAGLHGGVAGWNAQTEYVAPQVGLHAGGQLYYDYFSPYVIGFRIGLTLDHHRPAFGRLGYEDHYSTLDVDNRKMDIDYTIGSLRERYAIWSVGFPVQLALSLRRFSLFIGPKVVFPFACTWQETVDHVALSVYYPDYGNRIEESYPLAASRDFSMTRTGRMPFHKVQWWLSAELSYAIPLNTWAAHYRSYLMIGACFNYCPTACKPAHSPAESLVMLTDTRDGFPLQRVLTPLLEANRQNKPLVSDCRLFDVGIKISYAIGPYDPHQAARSACRCP